MQGVSVSNSGVVGNTQTPSEGAAGIFGTTDGSHSKTYGTESARQVAGTWGDTTGNPNTSSYAAGVIGTADNAEGGTFFNDSALYATIYASNLNADSTSVGISGITAGGIGVDGQGFTGVYGTSTYGFGVKGVLGSPSAEGAKYTIPAAMWPDTSDSDANALQATADKASAAEFFNNGPLTRSKPIPCSRQKTGSKTPVPSNWCTARLMWIWKRSSARL